MAPRKKDVDDESQDTHTHQQFDELRGEIERLRTEKRANIQENELLRAEIKRLEDINKLAQQNQTRKVNIQKCDIPNLLDQQIQLGYAGDMTKKISFNTFFWLGFRDYSCIEFRYKRRDAGIVCETCAKFIEDFEKGQLENKDFKNVIPVNLHNLISFHQMSTPEPISMNRNIVELACEHCHTPLQYTRKASENCQICRIKYAQNWIYFQQRPFDAEEIIIPE